VCSSDLTQPVLQMPDAGFQRLIGTVDGFQIIADLTVCVGFTYRQESLGERNAQATRLQQDPRRQRNQTDKRQGK